MIANGSVIVQGSDVKSATATNQQNQTTGATQAVVSISLTDKGTKAFADATTAAYAAGQSIGIYYDGQFVSVPKVNAAITDGKCVIEGMKTFDEADSLASYIRIGGLNLELKELQSEVVGAQLGSSALSTSLLAAAIGLIPGELLDVTVSVGNAAGEGAISAALSGEAREELARLQKEMRYVELSTHKKFSDEYMEQMYFE